MLRKKGGICDSETSEIRSFGSQVCAILNTLRGCLMRKKNSYPKGSGGLFAIACVVGWSLQIVVCNTSDISPDGLATVRGEIVEVAVDQFLADVAKLHASDFQKYDDKWLKLSGVVDNVLEKTGFDGPTSYIENIVFLRSADGSALLACHPDDAHSSGFGQLREGQALTVYGRAALSIRPPSYLYFCRVARNSY